MKKFQPPELSLPDRISKLAWEAMAKGDDRSALELYTIAERMRIAAREKVAADG